jgi:hypothetical protein
VVGRRQQAHRAALHRHRVSRQAGRQTDRLNSTDGLI